MSTARDPATRRHRQKPVRHSEEMPEAALAEQPQDVAHEDLESMDYTPMSGCLRVAAVTCCSRPSSPSVYGSAYTRSRISPGSVGSANRP